MNKYLYILLITALLSSISKIAMAQDSEDYNKAIQIKMDADYWGEGRGDDRRKTAEVDLYRKIMNDITGYQEFEYVDDGTKVLLIYFGNVQIATVTEPPQPDNNIAGKNNQDKSNDNTTKKDNPDKPVHPTPPVSDVLTDAEQKLVDDLLKLKTFEDIRKYCAAREYNKCDIKSSTRNDGNGTFRIILDRQGKVIAFLDKKGKYDLLNNKDASVRTYVEKRNPIFSISLLPPEN